MHVKGQSDTLQYLLETGDGCATITSIPSFFTSGAKLAPKDDRKLLVAA